MIVIDTDILSLVLWEQSADADRMTARLVESGHPIRVTIVSIEEQMRGWLSRIARSRVLDQQVEAYSRLRRMIEDIRDFELLDFDKNAAVKFAELRKSKIRIGSMDLKIAAVALANEATLISRDLRDFERVPGLDVQDWTGDGQRGIRQKKK